MNIMQLPRNPRLPYFRLYLSYPHVLGEALKAVLGLPVKVLAVLRLPRRALPLELALQARSVET